MASDFTDRIDSFLKGHTFANLIVFANEADAHTSALFSLAQDFRKIAQFQSWDAPMHKEYIMVEKDDYERLQQAAA